MKSIIVGAGKVGYTIASTLSKEGHDVIVIDIDRERLSTVEEYLDVQVIEGSGAQMSILEEAGIANTDLLIAVTEGDELNMVSCFLAKSYGVKSTVARVREPGYESLDNSHRQHNLGIDLIINPEKVAAEEILKLINHPEAHNVEYFANGQVQLLELELDGHCPVLNKSLIQICFPKPCIIVAIIRRNKTIIPRGQDRLIEGDIIVMLSATKNMIYNEQYLGMHHGKTNSVIIFGGGLLGYYLAQKLENSKRHMNIKLVEQDAVLAEELAETLDQTLVINGTGTDLGLLEDENVEDIDVCIAVTDDDKENVLVSILAKHMGTKKTIAQIRRSDYISMVERVGIDRAVSPRSLTAAAILKFISHGRLLSLTLLDDSRAQMRELIIPAKAKIIGKTLKQLKVPEDAIIGVIVRNGEVIVPCGDDKLLANDRIILFAS
ncbi:MAG: Trk system potassium transporter TrkA, partial [Clostridia bacterium]|nr:Trk system potassium transporter TrkA [Clostridia bacterium]